MLPLRTKNMKPSLTCTVTVWNHRTSRFGLIPACRQTSVLSRAAATLLWQDLRSHSIARPTKRDLPFSSRIEHHPVSFCLVIFVWFRNYLKTSWNQQKLTPKVLQSLTFAGQAGYPFTLANTLSPTLNTFDGFILRRFYLRFKKTSGSSLVYNRKVKPQT